MSADRELVLTRLINAPREKVYRAWTDPEMLKRWFAPLPYTTPVAELNVRPGGANLIVMECPGNAHGEDDGGWIGSDEGHTPGTGTEAHVWESGGFECFHGHCAPCMSPRFVSLDKYSEVVAEVPQLRAILSSNILDIIESKSGKLSVLS